jgi:hypothetical protein
MVIWYIFPRFGIFYPEKSGNTDPEATSKNGRPHLNRASKMATGLKK